MRSFAKSFAFLRHPDFICQEIIEVEAIARFRHLIPQIPMDLDRASSTRARR